ncbi:reverse transcriptase (RNA-dependent DNA polymerase) domain-containing protein [Phthorimaea operculella]|nr:reverse transcriptase (RNA-dependent DNA polymerase) domain-containing protein [Phthorimaea operculella]
MTKIDLSQAYLHIPIAKAHHRFLAFVYKNVVYEMTCLPFGLASAPCAFANITNWVANYFRKEGIRVIVYLDDFLIIHSNPQVLEKQTQQVLECLINLGWCINTDKSILIPTRNLEYLGIEWNTLSNTKSLPEPKIHRTLKLINNTLKKNWWSWQTAKVILGHINFAAFIVPLGRLHCRPIQIEANRLPENQRNQKFHLTDSVKQELLWWKNHIDQTSPIHYKDPTVFVTTDASNQGWGATINNIKLNGSWTLEQRSWHSNRKEMWTLKEVLQRYASHFCHRTVLAQTDNKSVAAYITKEGGTKSQTLFQLTVDIFEIVQRHQIHLIARYLPGRIWNLRKNLIDLETENHHQQ